MWKCQFSFNPSQPKQFLATEDATKDNTYRVVEKLL